MVSGATFTSEGYLQSLQSRARPGAGCDHRARRPASGVGTSSTSWACRSASPCAAGTPTTAARAARGPRRWPRCGTSTGCSAPIVPTRSSRGSPAASSPRATARRRSPRCSRSGELARLRVRTAPSTYARRRRRSTRAVSSRAGRSSARPHRCGRCPDTDVCLRPAATWSATSPARTRRTGGSASRTRTTRRGWWPGARAQRRRRDLRASPTAVATSSTPAPAPYRTRSPRSPSSTTTGPADIDATAAFALGRDAARWLRTRPRRTGLVVWADGRTELVG